MNVVIPDWTRQFVTATTETDTGETVPRYTRWRAVLDPTHLRRHPATCHEIDLNVVADDALHGPGQCGTDCHETGDRAVNLCGMSVPGGDEREVTDAARTALAEQGFRIDGPWIPGPNGTLTAPLVPVILDPTCAAYEPETAANLPPAYGPGDIVNVAKWGDTKFRVLGTGPQYEGGRRVELVHVASLSGNLSGHVDPSEVSRAVA